MAVRSDTETVPGGPPGKIFARWTMMLALQSIVAGVAALCVHGIFGLVHWFKLGSYCVIGITIALAAWVGETVWQVSVSHLLKHPDGARVMIMKLPLWFIAGGIGYVAGMLLSKKFGLTGFYDIPVRPLFVTGGILGCALQLLMHTAGRLRARRAGT